MKQVDLNRDLLKEGQSVNYGIPCVVGKIGWN
jgi:hypothetical protein